MPLITVTAGTPVLRPRPTKRRSSASSRKNVDQFSKPGGEDDFLEWTWLVEGDDKDVEITSSIRRNRTQVPHLRIPDGTDGAGNVNINDGFEENDLVGKKAQLSIIVTEDGSPRSTRSCPGGPASGVGPASTTPRRSEPPVVAPSNASTDGLDDDLPF
jgi:hypothetical protein